MGGDNRNEILIIVRPEKGTSEQKTLRGLRWILKRSLRNYGLKCIRIEILRIGNTTERENDEGQTDTFQS